MASEICCKYLGTAWAEEGWDAYIAYFKCVENSLESDLIRGLSEQAKARNRSDENALLLKRT